MFNLFYMGYILSTRLNNSKVASRRVTYSELSPEDLHSLGGKFALLANVISSGTMYVGFNKFVQNATFSMNERIERVPISS